MATDAAAAGFLLLSAVAVAVAFLFVSRRRVATREFRVSAKPTGESQVAVASAQSDKSYITAPRMDAQQAKLSTRAIMAAPRMAAAPASEQQHAEVREGHGTSNFAMRRRR